MKTPSASCFAICSCIWMIKEDIYSEWFTRVYMGTSVTCHSFTLNSQRVLPLQCLNPAANHVGLSEAKTCPNMTSCIQGNILCKLPMAQNHRISSKRWPYYSGHSFVTYVAPSYMKGQKRDSFRAVSIHGNPVATARLPRARIILFHCPDVARPQKGNVANAIKRTMDKKNGLTLDVASWRSRRFERVNQTLCRLFVVLITCSRRNNKSTTTAAATTTAVR